MFGPSIDISLVAVTATTLSIFLAFALAISHGVLRGTSHARTKKKSTKPLTFRISNIPRDLDKETFEIILNDLAGLPGTPPVLLGLSFTKSGRPEQSSVATVTFLEPPAPSQLESAIKSAIGHNSAHLRVDLDFFGLTPLADCPEAAVEYVM
jgi:hypothetical protein